MAREAEDLLPGGAANVVARYVGERIDTRAIDPGARLGEAPLVVRAGETGCAVLFRYGAVVLFGLDAVEQASFLKHLEPLVADPVEVHESEALELRVDAARGDRVEHGIAYVRDARLSRVQAIAEILAKSVVLAHYERRIAQLFERVQPIALDIQAGGRGGRLGRDLLQFIGGTLLTQNRMVGLVEVGEKPEFLWDDPEGERLYLRLEDEFELVERHRALEDKFDLISRTAETMLQLSNDRRALRVEWYIVLLIVFEILLTLYDMFLRA